MFLRYYSQNRKINTMDVPFDQLLVKQTNSPGLRLNIKVTDRQPNQQNVGVSLVIPLLANLTINQHGSSDQSDEKIRANIPDNPILYPNTGTSNRTSMVIPGIKRVEALATLNPTIEPEFMKHKEQVDKILEQHPGARYYPVNGKYIWSRSTDGSIVIGLIC